MGLEQSQDPWKQFRTVGDECQDRKQKGGWGTLLMLVIFCAFVGALIGGMVACRVSMSTRRYVRSYNSTPWATESTVKKIFIGCTLAGGGFGAIVAFRGWMQASKD